MKALIFSLLFILSFQSAADTSSNLKKIWSDERASLKEKSYFALSQFSSNPKWKKRWLIERTTRLLRAGRGLTPTENINDIEQKTEDEWIDQLMSDERFSDAMLDFNMYILGFKADEVYNEYGYDPSVFEFSNAIDSARTMTSGGDYFKLLDFFTNDQYMGPLGPLRARGKEDKTLSSEQLRQLRFNNIQESLLKLIEEIKINPNMTAQAACNKIQSSNAVYFGLGLPVSIAINGFILNPSGNLLANGFCFGSGAPPPASGLIPILEQIHANNKKFWNELVKFEFKNYSPKKISEIQKLDMKAAGIPTPVSTLSFSQRQGLPNSSTNYNRKRASYVLKQFFCDDLTPVAVENPATHTNGPHGSETSCYACHYKLDPMAGFFRNYGIFWVDFNAADRIIFDDQVIQPRQSYIEAWKSKHPKREFEVGYIRSVNSEVDNEYGESLEDLSKIMRKAPEVKRCMVKRMFEYFVAPDQMVDAGYIDYLTNQMIKDSAKDSTLAVKNTVRQLLKSQSFKEHDMDPSQCYDYPPAGAPKDAPPCRVAFLLQKNCVQCHSSTKASGNLDLSRWVPMPDGTFNFPHLDKQGQQRSTKDTIGEFISRINSSDEELRMPYKKLMTSQDRQELYLWAEGILK